MVIDAKPIKEAGEKNVFCPHYRQCLDHASKHYWEYWTCAQCASNNVHVPPLVAQSLVSARDDGTDYMVSPIMAKHAAHSWLKA